MLVRLRRGGPAVLVVGAFIHPGFAIGSSLRRRCWSWRSFIGFVAAGPDARDPRRRHRPVHALGAQRRRRALRRPASLGRDTRAAYAVAAVALGLGAAVGLVNGVLRRVARRAGRRHDARDERDHARADARPDARASPARRAPRTPRRRCRRRSFARSSASRSTCCSGLGVVAVRHACPQLDDVRPPGLRDRQQPRAAFLAGVGVRVVTVVLYMLSGVFAALAGIVLVAYGGQPTLGMGDPYLFQSIAAVVIGGVSILGGRGHYVGMVAGAVGLVAPDQPPAGAEACPSTVAASSTASRSSPSSSSSDARSGRDPRGRDLRCGGERGQCADPGCQRARASRDARLRG